MSFTQTPIY